MTLLLQYHKINNTVTSLLLLHYDFYQGLFILYYNLLILTCSILYSLSFIGIGILFSGVWKCIMRMANKGNLDFSIYTQSIHWQCPVSLSVFKDLPSLVTPWSPGRQCLIKVRRCFGVRFLHFFNVPWWNALIKSTWTRQPGPFNPQQKVLRIHACTHTHTHTHRHFPLPTYSFTVYLYQMLACPFHSSFYSTVVSPLSELCFPIPLSLLCASTEGSPLGQF